jgi:hypothetical protein
VAQNIKRMLMNEELFSFQLKNPDDKFSIVLESLLEIKETQMAQTLILSLLLAKEFPEKHEELSKGFFEEARKWKIELLATLASRYSV